MRHYTVDEFNNRLDTTTDTTEIVVEKKISLLYDFCILVKRKGLHGVVIPDPREETVREMLTACETELVMTNRLHDVLKGEYDLNTLLQRNGYTV